VRGVSFHDKTADRLEQMCFLFSPLFATTPIVSSHDDDDAKTNKEKNGKHIPSLFTAAAAVAADAITREFKRIFILVVAI
jgi:hypothetical protein